jgi:hypothetical protein
MQTIRSFLPLIIPRHATLGSGQFARFLSFFPKPDAVSACLNSGQVSVLDFEGLAASGCRSRAYVGRVDSSQ